jgi:ankyrin repeat protein
MVGLQRGFSPLMCACSLEGTAHLVRVLIRKGANINFAAVRNLAHCSPCGLTKSSFACDGISFVQADSGLTPLLAAAKAGNSKATHYLLEKGANTAARDVRASLSLLPPLVTLLSR